MPTNWISRIVKPGAVGVLMSACAGVALAQGVANSPPQIWPINSANTWEIGNAANPVPVALDPNGNQPWTKSLTDQNGPFPPGAITPGALYTLHEYLLVDPAGPAWTDWHEDILEPFWTWTSGSLQVIFGTPTLPPAPVGLGTPNISFFFSPVAPGSIIEITKQLVYTGPVPTNFGSVRVNEYPTGVPEPTSLLLISAASVLLMKRSRHGITSVN